LASYLQVGLIFRHTSTKTFSKRPSKLSIKYHIQISALRLKNSKIVTWIIIIPAVAVVGTVVTVLTVLTVGVVAVVADSVVNVVGALVLSTTHKHTHAVLRNSSVKNWQINYR